MSTASGEPPTGGARPLPHGWIRHPRERMLITPLLAGWHPDDWQRAHFYDPRFVDPMSLMPDMKSLFSDKQIDQLVAFVEQRSGKSGLLRYAGQLYAKHVVLVNQGFPPPYTGFQGAHKPPLESNDKILAPPKNQLEEAPNLAQIDRSYWLAGDPLPVTEGNLLRGKE